MKKESSNVKLEYECLNLLKQEEHYFDTNQFCPWTTSISMDNNYLDKTPKTTTMETSTKTRTTTASTKTAGSFSKSFVSC